LLAQGQKYGQSPCVLELLVSLGDFRLKLHVHWENDTNGDRFCAFQMIPFSLFTDPLG